jgi:carnitine O-acetyltransferase
MEPDQREASPLQFDATGKVTLDHLYDQDDPRAYFEALRDLDYSIPQLAKPYFAKLVQDYREAERVEVPTVLDVGCSYGVNAALLRCDASIDELYERYSDDEVARLSRDELVVRDRAFVQSRQHLDPARFVGLDVSGPALAYALDAGLLDGAVRADLESGTATDEHRRWFGRAHLVVSTGCVGYVSERTLRQVAEAAAEGQGRLPWMAHFVLRMFSYEPIAESLAELGYDSVQIEGTFKQRRFASAQEQEQVLDGLSAAGVDPRGLEDDGWLYAQLHLSLPSGTRKLTEAGR